MYTSINFIVDTSRLPAAGTFERPAFTHHFEMSVDRDMAGAHTVSAGGIVRVGSSDRVDLALVDRSLGLRVELAPVLLLAHMWNGDVLTPKDMADSNPEKPIDKPRYDVRHNDVPKMQYKGSETGWQQVSSDNHLWWSNGAKIAQDVSVTRADLYRPYVTFNFQGLVGLFQYGIEFAVSKNGETIGYYYFDPQIQAG